MQGLAGSYVVGSTHEIYGYVSIPASIDDSDATARWELIDDAGVVYTLGFASNMLREHTEDPQYDLVTCSSIITIPIVPASDYGSKYKIRWTYQADQFIGTSSDLLTIIPAVSSDIGALDSVELYGESVTLMAVLPDSTPVSLSIFMENLPVFQVPSLSPVSSSPAGFDFKLDIPTIGSDLRPSLRPYSIIWSQGSAREISRLFILNPSLLDCLKEMNTFFNRLKRECRLEELSVKPTDMLAMLKSGADMFNGYGLYTDFDFTNAQGAIRHWWLVCSRIATLRTMYLEEALSTFDFSGQAISLSVDITSHLESLASVLESQLESQLVPLKKQLHKRGILSGDGAAVSYVAKTRGAIGLTLSPVSRLGSTVGNARGILFVRRL
jgi:hypothetical protein